MRPRVRKLAKKLLSLSTSVAMTLTVIACGGDNNNDDGGSIDAGPGGSPSTPPESTCTVEPGGQFDPVLECSWNKPAAGSLYPEFDDVVMAPVVINLTDDNGDSVIDLEDIPDIAFISYARGSSGDKGVLRVVSGGCQDGTLPEHYSVGPNEIETDIDSSEVWLDFSSGLAAGDIDADGSADIVATTQNGGTIAFERDGRVKWYQPDHPIAGDYLDGSQPAIADLDGDGAPEVIQGRVVLNGEDGSLAWQGTSGLGTNGFLGPVSTSGDLDLDGRLNVLAGASSYDPQGTELWTYDYPIPISDANCRHKGYPCDGFTATGNFDGDDQGEVVIVRAGVVYLVNHDGTAVRHDGAPIEIDIPMPAGACSSNEGGPPTVADFDGDGDAEIGVAGAKFYIVADLECLTSPLPDHCSDHGIRWKVPNRDCSSRVTGSSVFDFDGDGQAEVVYSDEKKFRILSGVDGAERLSVPNFSQTRLEMPIVADVDNDGNAEIVFVENSGSGPQGVRVWGDAADSWVPTRRIWNQHSYHVTNVGELGEIPASEPVNWLQPTEATNAGVMNNFRQNLPSANAFAAPDLTIALSFNSPTCELLGEVCNDGDIVAGAGIAITFFDRATERPITCENGPTHTASPLSPGSCEWVSCTVDDSVMFGPHAIRACVDNQGYDCEQLPIGGNRECDDDNNWDDEPINIACGPIP